jgi:hypothetical protein
VLFQEKMDSEADVIPSEPVSSTTSSPGASASSTPAPQGSGDAFSMIKPQQPSLPKYAQLLAVIEEMGKDLRPTYAGSKSSAERLKRGIVHSRILVRECLMETERSARQ